MNLHKNSVQFPKEYFTPPTWPPFLCLLLQHGRRDVMWTHSIQFHSERSISSWWRFRQGSRLWRLSQTNASYECVTPERSHAKKKSSTTANRSPSEGLVLGRPCFHRTFSRGNSQRTESIRDIDTSTTTAQRYFDVAVNSYQSGFA